MAMAGEVAWLRRAQQAVAEGAAAAARAQAEAESLRSRQPAPSVDNADEIAADLHSARRVLAVLRDALVAPGEATPVSDHVGLPPEAATSRTEAFFKVAGFVDRFRRDAAARRVPLLPDARHAGFAAYATEAPTTGLVTNVLAQLRTLDHVLTALLDAQPHALIAVRREEAVDQDELSPGTGSPVLADVPGAKVTRAASSRARPSAMTAWKMDPVRSLRASGHVHAFGLEVVFVGVTATLRGFLDRLGERGGLLIREMSVEPLSEADALALSAATSDARFTSEPAADTLLLTNGAAPTASGLRSIPPSASPLAADLALATPPRTELRSIVARQLSRFTVTLEQLELAPLPSHRPHEPAITPFSRVSAVDTTP